MKKIILVFILSVVAISLIGQKISDLGTTTAVTDASLLYIRYGSSGNLIKKISKANLFQEHLPISDTTAMLAKYARLLNPVFLNSITIGSAIITEPEFEILDGALWSTAEGNYLVGVTGGIQSQLNAKVTMTYPGEGIALSDGSMWGTSITNNSANWNTAYGWGDPSGVYAPIAQTFYIGTTQVAINRTSAALTLAGLTLTTPNLGTPSAGILTNCTFPTLNQSTTGSAATLTTPRTIGGTSFNGSSNITVASATGGFTVSGGNLAVTGNITTTGTVDGIDIASAVSLNTAKLTNATHSGDVTGSGALTIATDAVDIAMLSATGTASSSTYLRGDNTWGTPSGGSSASDIAYNATSWNDNTDAATKNAIRDKVESIVTDIDDTEDAFDLYTELADSCYNAQFGYGARYATDTLACVANNDIGSFYNSGSDTLNSVSIRGVVYTGEGTPTVGVRMYYDVNLWDATPTAVIAETNITSTTSGTVITSFSNQKIPPNVWVWMEIETVSSGNKPTALRLTYNFTRIPTY